MGDISALALEGVRRTAGKSLYRSVSRGLSVGICIEKGLIDLDTHTYLAYKLHKGVTLCSDNIRYFTWICIQNTN